MSAAPTASMGSGSALGVAGPWGSVGYPWGATGYEPPRPAKPKEQAGGLQMPTVDWSDLPSPSRRDAVAGAVIGTAAAGIVWSRTRPYGPVDAPYVYPWTQGNDVRLLKGYDEWLPVLYEDMENAKGELAISQYNWEPSGPGGPVARIMKEKATQPDPLQVSAITDKRGTFGADSRTPKDVAQAYFDDLSAHNVDVRVSDPGRKLNPIHQKLFHPKLHFAGPDIAHAAGMGFADDGDKYVKWHDYALRIKGPGALQVRDYHYGQHERLGGTLKPIAGESGPGDGASAVRLLPNDPKKHLNATRDFIEMARAPGEDRFWTMTPYTGTDLGVNEIEGAARAGKDARVLVPSPATHTNGLFLKLGRTWYIEMLQSGARVAEADQMIHAKAWGNKSQLTVGSTNVSDGAFRWYHETSVAVRDAEVAADFLQDFEKRWGTAKELTLNDFGLGWRAFARVRRFLRFQF